MPRLRLTLATLALALGAPLGSVTAAQAAAPDTALPATGLDFSGVDQFWKIADILSRDAEPTEAQWHALLATPGYRLARTNLGPVIRQDLEVTFRPSRRADFTRLSAGTDDRALRLKHLALALRERPALVALRDSLARGTPIADAVARAAKFLPPGATTHGNPPLVAFAIFTDDNYSLPRGVAVDLLYARRTPLILILAHEFHHTYVNRLAKPVPPGPAAPDATIRDALYDARNEGIADQIDKPQPFTSPNPAMAQYVARYNAEYSATPATLHQFDSLLTLIADHPARMDELGMTAQMLFWSNGHPNGAYIAHEIIETFGVDSLFPAVRDPAAFLRTYAAAERVHGRPAPFSPKAWRVIDALDANYWR
jgi:hypothetical protein